jgi:hypothetical protein
MKRLPILILFLARGFAADAPPTERVIKMFPLKYADSEQVRKLFSSYSYPMSTNRDFNVLTVTAPASFVAQVEAAVKQFDVAPVPPKNIELSVYLLTGADAPGPTPLPKELLEMEKQLIASSSYKAYHLADTQVIRLVPASRPIRAECCRSRKSASAPPGSTRMKKAASSASMVSASN